MCLGTFSRLRRSLATSTLYAAVRILAERFLLYREAISCKVKKFLRRETFITFIQSSLCVRVHCAHGSLNQRVYRAFRSVRFRSCMAPESNRFSLFAQRCDCISILLLSSLAESGQKNKTSVYAFGFPHHGIQLSVF